MLPYAVVMFVASGTVAIISTLWFTSDEEDECYWPPTCSSAKVKKLVQAASIPTDSWKKYSVRVLGKAADIAKAEAKLLRAEVTSDLRTDTEDDGPSTSKRRPKPNQWYMDSGPHSAAIISDTSDSDTDSSRDQMEIPPPPPPASTPTAPVTATLGRSQETPSSSRSSNGIDQKFKDETEKHFLKLIALNEAQMETQRIQGRILDSILRKIQGEATRLGELPEGITFPIKSMEEFDQADDLLKDSSVLNRAVPFVSELGGRTIDEATRRMMGYVLTNDLSLKFNLVGRHGKKAFGTTQVFELVYRAMKNNSRTSGINKKEFEKAISKWLSNGRDRDGNRAKRALAERMRRVADQP